MIGEGAEKEKRRGGGKREEMGDEKWEDGNAQRMERWESGGDSGRGTDRQTGTSLLAPTSIFFFCECLSCR